MESSLPLAPRLALAAVTLLAGGGSTSVIAWCGRPYVVRLRRFIPSENDGTEGLEMTTQTMWLQPVITRVYDTDFLVDAKRPFAKWELANAVTLPSSKITDLEETVAETFAKNGKVLGRWIVKWDQDGNGTCHEVGKMVRFFNVHTELLQWHKA